MKARLAKICPLLPFALIFALGTLPAFTQSAEYERIAAKANALIEKEEITVTAEETALFTEIVVEDNGPGISKEDLPYLFDRFYKGEGSSDDSVGIGLALSRSIIAAQNGTIKAENVPTGGARFTIRFYKSVI